MTEIYFKVISPYVWEADESCCKLSDHGLIIQTLPILIHSLVMNVDDLIENNM